MKKIYLAEFTTSKAEKRKKGAKGVADPLPHYGEKNDVTFSATFGEKMHAKLFTDVGTDENLADDTLARRVYLAGSAVGVQGLIQPVVFSLAVEQGRDGDNGNDIDIVCHQKAKMNVECVCTMDRHSYCAILCG